MPHDHHDDDDHSHSTVPSEPALKVKAIETLLVEKGLVDPAAIDAVVDHFSNRVGPQNGARVVAKAWADSSYREWLFKDATAAVASFGFTGYQGEHIVAVENTNDVHNIVVCTLCSCYPWPLLGVPPTWYKSPEYRARVVREPRQILAEFGVSLAPDTRICIWDSTAEIRYLVIPTRPLGSDGFSEERLAQLVTRNSMIGTGLAINPGSK